jgi:hypothetical protein
MTSVLNIREEVDIRVEISGKKLADLFWQMDSDEQAEFFNELHELSGAYKLSMQLQFISDDISLTGKGRSVMRSIGDYSEEQL